MPSSERLSILETLKTLQLPYGSWPGLIEAWPAAEEEDLRSFYRFSRAVPTNVQNYDKIAVHPLPWLQALDARFGASFWNCCGLDVVADLAHAYVSLPLSEDTVRDEMKRHFLKAIAYVLTRPLPLAQRQSHPRSSEWLNLMSHLMTHIPRPKGAGEVVSAFFNQVWVTPTQELDGEPVWSKIRTGTDLKAWIAAGGHLDQKGWDASRSDRPIWADLQERVPALAPHLQTHSEEAKEGLMGAPSLEMSKRLENKLFKLTTHSNRKSTTVETWAKTLTSEPGWFVIRAQETQTPLWLWALKEKPALLGRICEWAQDDEEFRAHLKDTDLQGRGIWHVLLQSGVNRSLTEKRLAILNQYLPPQSVPTLKWSHLPQWENKRHEMCLKAGLGYVPPDDFDWICRTLPLKVCFGDSQDQKFLLDQKHPIKEEILDLLQKKLSFLEDPCFAGHRLEWALSWSYEKIKNRNTSVFERDELEKTLTFIQTHQQTENFAPFLEKVTREIHSALKDAKEWVHSSRAFTRRNATLEQVWVSRLKQFGGAIEADFRVKNAQKSSSMPHRARVRQS